MKPAPRKPPIPRTAQETVRHLLVALLSEQTLSAKEISAAAHIAEKEVYGHLEHIRLSLAASGSTLVITPAECRACGFVFGKRDRLTTPGRCPVCRDEAILEPLFTVRRRSEQG
jgi:transcriptional regulator